MGPKDPFVLWDGDERRTELSSHRQLRNRTVTVRVGPRGRDTWESPHRNGATGPALSGKARGCDTGQRCGCPTGVLRASGASEGVCQGNSTPHKGMQTKMASLPLPCPGKEGVGEEDGGRRAGVRGKEEPKATPGMRTAMAGRDTLARGGPQTAQRWGRCGEGAPGERHHRGQGHTDPMERGVGGVSPHRAGTRRASGTSLTPACPGSRNTGKDPD